MHVSVETMREARNTVKAQNAKLLRNIVFNGCASMHYSEPVNRVENAVNLSRSAAKRRVDGWVQLGVVEKNFAGLWVPSN
jgi:hypothetical protein